MPELIFRNIYKSFSDGTIAVNNFNLKVEDKEYLVLVGEEGSGKSTILRIISGIEDITQGDLFIDYQKCNYLLPKHRNFSLVYTQLYPGLTIKENLSFGLRLKKLSVAEIGPRIQYAASVLGITDLLSKTPGELSQVEQLKVALARSVASKPSVILLDESFKGLNDEEQQVMISTIKNLQKHLEITFIHVTDDAEEALALGTKIVVMKDGFIQQVGTADELTNSPSNIYVATFFGKPQINIVNVSVSISEESIELTANSNLKLTIPYYKELQSYSSKEISLGIRPEYVSISEHGNITATVREISDGYVTLAVKSVVLSVKLNENTNLIPESEVTISIDINGIYYFNKENSKIIIINKE